MGLAEVHAYTQTKAQIEHKEKRRLFKYQNSGTNVLSLRCMMWFHHRYNALLLLQLAFQLMQISPHSYTSMLMLQSMATLGNR